MSFNDNSSVVFFVISLPPAQCALSEFLIPHQQQWQQSLHCIHKRRLGIWFVYPIKAHLWIHFGQPATATISVIFLATNVIYRDYKFMHACDLNIQNDFAAIKWELIFYRFCSLFTLNGSIHYTQFVSVPAIIFGWNFIQVLIIIESTLLAYGFE